MWSAPERVAIYDDAPVGDGVAQAAWRVAGSSETRLESWSFFIDALTGVVVRHTSNIADFAGEVEGVVTGYATPGTAPHTFPGTAAHCPNPPQEMDLRDVWVGAYLAGTQTLLHSSFTDENGYSLDVPSSTSVDVLAELKGPGWVILDGAQQPLCGEPLTLPYGSAVTTPAAGVDFTFNPSQTQTWTAAVNAHRHLSKVWRWLDLEIDSVPGAPVIIQVNTPCGAAVRAPGFGCYEQWSSAAIYLGHGTNTCASSAYSTIIAHEYGHFLSFHLFDNQGSEGFCDALALLVNDTEFAGEDFFGCDDRFRYPRESGLQQYPKCKPGPSDPPACSMGRSWDQYRGYCIGELLAALWRDMHVELGGTAARELFLDWMMIAQTPASVICEIGGSTLQAAGPNTLVEVLQVADDDQVAAICNIFEIVREIPHPDPPCGDSAGWFCYADCDGNAVLDFWDFLCFQEAFVAGDSYADCDGDGEFSFFDFLCFQNSFVAGCP